MYKHVNTSHCNALVNKLVLPTFLLVNNLDEETIDNLIWLFF